MANVKSVEIEALVPFDWLVELPDEDRLKFISFLSPTEGLELSYDWVGLIPNPDGSNGRTTIYSLTISGREAIYAGIVKDWVEILDRVGDVRVATIEDIED